MFVLVFNVCFVLDMVFVDIVDYVLNIGIDSVFVLEMVCYCLIDMFGCGFEVLFYFVCIKLFGFVVFGMIVLNGVKVFGMFFQFDFVQVVFGIGVMICWLDFNDIWFVVEWGYLFDNFGGILVMVDWFFCMVCVVGWKLFLMCDVLVVMIQVYEIQGCFVFENLFNVVGFDYVLFVKVVLMVVVGWFFGFMCDELINVVFNVFVDGYVLCIYCYVLNIGLCKFWVVGDVMFCVVCFVLIVKMGEMGYLLVFIVKIWGFYDVLFDGKLFCFQCLYGMYVMENVLFKIVFFVEFYVQMVVEVVLQLYVQFVVVGCMIDDISWIMICMYVVVICIIDKQGLFVNLVDCDYCIQYMVVVLLLFGWLIVVDYEDLVVVDLCIDVLCVKIVCVEDLQFMKDYYDLDK